MHQVGKLSKLVPGAVLLGVLGVSGPSSANPPEVHNPQGSFLLGLSGGASFSRNASVYAIGASAGYAVYHGVVPGARGVVFFGSYEAGETAATLLLTPPLGWVAVPFVGTEAGYRWEPQLDGPLLGVGFGLFVGRPRDSVNVQAGWMFRRFWHDLGSADISGPVISLSIRF